MTDIAPEVEKAPESGRQTAKAGATFLTLTLWLVIGGLAGLLLASAIKDPAPAGTTNPIGFFLLIPLAIGVIQRTTSDKMLTWYKREAQIAGFLVGAIATYATF